MASMHWSTSASGPSRAKSDLPLSSLHGRNGASSPVLPDGYLLGSNNLTYNHLLAAPECVPRNRLAVG